MILFGRGWGIFKVKKDTKLYRDCMFDFRTFLGGYFPNLSYRWYIKET